MLLYNTNGTVSNIQINAIIDGVVTSSLVTAPTIQQAFEASASNAIINKAITAGSSSNAAYELGNPKSTNTSNLGTTYLSSATTSGSIYPHVQYPWPSGSAASGSSLFANGVLVSSSKQAEEVKYPTSADLHTRGQRKTIMYPANSSFNSIIDGRVELTIGTSLTDASVSPIFNTINASKFTTTYSNGDVLVIGDDTKIVDVNLQNGMAIVGQQQSNRGWVKFGSGSNTPVWGHNGNQAALPAPGDGLYAVTGSLLVSSSKLLFYNGSGASGWAVLK
jgi:hypothetical protein